MPTTRKTPAATPWFVVFGHEEHRDPETMTVQAASPAAAERKFITRMREGAKGALIYVDGLVEVPGRRRPRIWRDGFGLRKTPV